MSNSNIVPGKFSPPASPVDTKRRVPRSPSTLKRDKNIKRNSKGGIHVTKRDIHALFEILDTEKKGFISIHGMKHKLNILMPGFAPKDLPALFNGKREISEVELQALLIDNEVTTADPVGDVFEAFATYVPSTAKGVAKALQSPSNSLSLSVPSSASDFRLDLGKFKAIFESMGLGTLTNEELEIISTAGDYDGDGSISLADFRKIIDLELNLTHHHQMPGNGRLSLIAGRPEVNFKLANAGKELIMKSTKASPMKASPGEVGRSAKSLGLFAFGESSPKEA